LGLFFIFLGVLKITPTISRDLHKDIRTEYAKYAKVFPLAKTLQVKVPSKWYRRIVGGTEIGSGLLMLLVPGRKAKNLGNLLLMATKILNLYSHWAINDKFERMAPSLVFFFMLVCRMVVDWQFARQEKEEELKEPTGQFDELGQRSNSARAVKNKKDQ
jgi:hypothetical protein